MNVDFNSVRKQALIAIDELTIQLNDSIIRENDQYAKPNDSKYEQNLNGYVLIDADDIKSRMDELRRLIGAIALTYIDGYSDFIDVYSEVFPSGQLTIFNEEE